MIKTNRKLKRLIEEEERTQAKIVELGEYLKEIRENRKREEDLQIIRSIRSMKLGARELFDLLGGIERGTISMEQREALLEGADEDADPEGNDSDKPDPPAEAKGKTSTAPDQKGAEESPEREENNDDR